MNHTQEVEPYLCRSVAKDKAPDKRFSIDSPQIFNCRTANGFSAGIEVHRVYLVEGQQFSVRSQQRGSPRRHNCVGTSKLWKRSHCPEQGEEARVCSGVFYFPCEQTEVPLPPAPPTSVHPRRTLRKLADLYSAGKFHSQSALNLKTTADCLL